MANHKSEMLNEGLNYKTEVIKDISTKNDLFAKLQIIGDIQVGKSAILSRITKNNFTEKYFPTFGYTFSPYVIKVNNTIIKFQIWDMCGNENYRSVLLNLYRNATIGILVYSICSRKSYNNLEKWISKLKKYSAPCSKLVLLGNKCDNEEKREVSFEEGKKICDKYDLLFFMEVSAKTGFNIQKILELAAIHIYQDYEINKNDENNISTTLMTESIILKANDNKNNNNCC